MKNHTCGPWFVSRTSEADQANGHQAFLVKPIPGQVICELDCLPEEEANANLIAAAPELYEAAVTACVEFINRTNAEPSDKTHWYWGLKRAVAKAQGKGKG